MLPRAISPIVVKSRGPFKHGLRHPRFRTNTELVRRLQAVLATYLVCTGKVEMRDRSRRYAEINCSICGRGRFVLVDNLLSNKSKGCVCQRGKYEDKEYANILGQRYDSMVQRCRRDTHVSSRNYKDRGIEVRFLSREHFIRWAMSKWTKEDVKAHDIDRVNNNGHYEPGNLRLLSRSDNLKNRIR